MPGVSRQMCCSTQCNRLTLNGTCVILYNEIEFYCTKQCFLLYVEPQTCPSGCALDYMCRLIDDIMTRFPAGQLPPVDRTTMRDPEEVAALLRGPLNGGKHLYTVAYPP
jgi:hypothetical protein